MRFSIGIHIHIFPDFYGKLLKIFRVYETLKDFSCQVRVPCFLSSSRSPSVTTSPSVSVRMDLGLHEFCKNVGSCNLLDQLKFKLPALQRFFIIHFTSAFT